MFLGIVCIIKICSLGYVEAGYFQVGKVNYTYIYVKSRLGETMLYQDVVCALQFLSEQSCIAVFFYIKMKVQRPILKCYKNEVNCFLGLQMSLTQTR